MSALVLSEIFPPKIGGSGHWLHEVYRRQAPARTVLLVGNHDEAAEFDLSSTLRIVRDDLSAPAWTVMNAGGRAYFRRLYRRAAALIRQHRLREIHCARVMPEGVVGYFASHRLGIRLVCFVHGEDIELAKRSRESRWLVARVIARADRLVCNSRNTRRMLLEDWGCKASKITVVYPGIDTDLFRPSGERTALRERLGWTDRPVIITVSRLEIRKGHDMLIDALPALIDRFPRLLYAVVGSGDEREALRERVERLGLSEHVDFRGSCETEEMIELLQASDVFALPNRQVGSSVEGFGMVLLEAQACATPVVAGNSGGTAETMIPGETGLVVDCTRARNLVEPLTSLLGDEARRAEMGRNGRRLMTEHFAWEKLAAEAADALFLDDVE